MLERKSLNDRKIKSLKRDEGLEDKLGHYDTWDIDVRGLGVRTSKTGRRTFVLMARYPGYAAPMRRKLGTYPEMTLAKAREKAKEWKELIERGIDPEIAEEERRQAELRKQANTFAFVAEAYLTAKVIGKQRKAADVVRAFRGIFIAIWGARPITSIAKGEVLRLIEGVRDNGTAATLAAYDNGPKADSKPAPGQARNLLGYLKTFFRWAAGRDDYGLLGSPCEYIKGLDVIGQREAVDRTLNDAEVQAFWRATERLPYPYGPVYRLLLLTGLRLNEVADADRNEFDAAKGVWILPASRMKGKIGKARPHSVPLTDDIRALLDTLPRFNRGDYLFSLTSGKTPVWVTDKVKRRLDAEMLLELQKSASYRGENPAKVKLPPWVNHDLRRTMRSGLSELGVDVDVAEAILAHKKPGIRGVYDLYEYFDEKQEALQLWSAHIKALTSPSSKAVAAKPVPQEWMIDDRPRASFAERAAWLSPKARA